MHAFTLKFVSYSTPNERGFGTLTDAILEAVGMVDENEARPLEILEGERVVWSDKSGTNIYDFARQHGIETDD